MNQTEIESRPEERCDSIRFDSIFIGCRFGTNSTQFRISFDSILIQFDLIRFAPPVTFLLLVLLVLLVLLLFLNFLNLFVSLYHRLYHPVCIVDCVVIEWIPDFTRGLVQEVQVKFDRSIDQRRHS
jgi:hypothetical protein